VQAGRFRDKSWSKTPCFGCRLAPEDPPHNGRCHVSHDASFALDAMAVSSWLRRDGADVHPSDAIDVFADFLRQLWKLDHKSREIVRLRMLDAAGERHTYAQIAKRLRVSPQYVERKHRELMCRIPAFSAAFAHKRAKQQRRAVRSKDGGDGC
jgi:hypothetical protein